MAAVTFPLIGTRIYTFWMSYTSYFYRIIVFISPVLALRDKKTLECMITGNYCNNCRISSLRTE